MGIQSLKNDPRIGLYIKRGGARGNGLPFTWIALGRGQGSESVTQSPSHFAYEERGRGEKVGRQ